MIQQLAWVEVLNIQVDMVEDNNNHLQDQFRYLQKKWSKSTHLFHMVSQKRELLKHILLVIKTLKWLPTFYLKLELMMKILLCRMQLMPQLKLLIQTLLQMLNQ